MKRKIRHCYFALMAPVYRLASRLRWPGHFLVLRTANWVLAYIGFCVGALTTQGVLRRRNATTSLLLVPLIWPFLFPQFFEEFTRLTNDTACFALASVTWFLLVRHFERGADWRRSVALGVVVGIGLLTKAFFLPVAAGLMLLLAFVAWRTPTSGAWRDMLLVPVVAFLVGGAW